MSSPSSTKRNVRYFVSYAHADDKIPGKLLSELQKQLGACREYNFERWRDTNILIGEKWHAEIQDALEKCDFGLLLVSPSFLGSKYITQHELPCFVKGDKPCLPVALCPIDFDNQDLKGLDATQIFRFTPPRAEKPKTFGDCTSANHRRDFAHELFNQIVARLGKIFATATSGSVPKVSASSGLDESAYRAHIRKHYRHLQLEALSGDQLTYRDIELQQVFIPQDARDCREWLPEALEVPAGLTIEAAEDDPTLKLAELHEHKRFRDTPSRNILEILNDHSTAHRVVLGAPGAGKSALTRIRLLTWMEDGVKRPLPILVELRRFHRSGRADFLEYLENDKDLVFRFRAEDLRMRLIAGSAELIFDGLDEIFDPVAREAAALQITRYAETYKDTFILVTSRLIGYPGRILRDAAFGHWLLADFDEEQIDEFLEHWLKDAIREPGDRPIVRERMEAALRSPVIRELAGNPLLLTLMAVLARKSDLPRDIASLYARASDLLLEQWDTHRMLAADVQLGSVIIDQKDKRDLLRDLSWKMQTGQRGLHGNLISKEEVESAMDIAFQHRIGDAGLRRKAIGTLIDQLTERNYILCHVGGAQFAFVHRGFLEFFASEYLVNIITQRPDTAISEIGEIYHAHAGEDAWSEVLTLAATRFEPAVTDKILLPLVENADEEIIGNAVMAGEPHSFTLVCAVLSRAREPQKLVATSARVRSILESWIRKVGNRFIGNSWVMLLVETFLDESTHALLLEVACRDESTIASRQAVASLAQHFRDENTRALLVELVHRDKNPIARRQAVASLAEYFRDQQTYSLLVELVHRNENTSARSQAVESLAELFANTETQALLVELACTSEDTRTRSQAVDSLAQHFRDENTHALLIELARSAEDTRARSQAVDSLALYYRDENTRALLVELVHHDKDTAARSKAVGSLAQHFRDENTRALFIELARSAEDTAARSKAVESLAQRFPDENTRAHPLGRKVHVHQQLHAGWSGNSTSSARHAQYFSA